MLDMASTKFFAPKKAVLTQQCAKGSIMKAQ